jgi:hypothetical protein
MDGVRKTLSEYTQAMTTRLVLIRKHNHPPMPGKVENCGYCKTFGNLFENGPVSLNDNRQLMSHMVCLNNI